MDSSTIRTISPVDGSVVVERKCHGNEQIDEILSRAKNAFKTHRRSPLKLRVAVANKFLDLLLEKKDILVLKTLDQVNIRVRN